MSEKLLNKRIKEYIKTGDELLFDDDVLTQIIKLIKYKYMGYVHRGFFTEEELIELCLFQIGKQLKSYNPDKGEVTTFLISTCKHIISNTIRDRKAQKRIPEENIISLNSGFYINNHPESKDLKYEDMLLSYEDPEYTGINYENYIIKACENIKKNNKTRSKMKYDLKKMFIMYYQGYTEVYMSKTEGITQVQVSRM